MSPNPKGKIVTPKETDTKLAALWGELYATRDRLDREHGWMLVMAGAQFYYRARRRVTDMTLETAIERLEAQVAKHADDEYGYGRLEAPCSASSSIAQARKSLAQLIEFESSIVDLENEIAELEATYTGWSRFFLVTSSSGHIHNSMHCSTCRPQTTYGWLPELSGQSESEAVDELGPTLCSVCFSSAPVDWTVGKKITAAQAVKKAA